MARISAHQWIQQIFQAKAVASGGIVRRKIAAVERYASEEALLAEVKRRDFHMVASGDQYIILCHNGRFDLLC